MQRQQEATGPSRPTQTITEHAHPEDDAPLSGTLHLRGHNPDRRRVAWTESTIDNEKLGRKSSKICCIYHKPKNFDESSSEDSSSSSDSDDTGDEHDNGKSKDLKKQKQNQKQKQKQKAHDEKRRRHSHLECEHECADDGDRETDVVGSQQRGESGCSGEEQTHGSRKQDAAPIEARGDGNAYERGIR